MSEVTQEEIMEVHFQEAERAFEDLTKMWLKKGHTRQDILINTLKTLEIPTGNQMIALTFAIMAEQHILFTRALEILRESNWTKVDDFVKCLKDEFGEE